LSTPQDFDVDAWLDDAERPTRSVTVYQKSGLIADLDRLAEKIGNAEADEEVDGPSMGGSSSAQLRAEYAKLAKQFHDSALVIRVEGRDQHERVKIADGVKDIEMKDATVLADAIQSPKFTPQQVIRLVEKIGGAQAKIIVDRFNEASEEVPSVSADFLPKHSTPGDGGE
jgi:hypothetical protein